MNENPIKPAPMPTASREASGPALGNAPAQAIARLSSQQLLGERGELIITHNGNDYSLRRTRNGKLILTK
jgi:hemin uptake protein HemP